MVTNFEEASWFSLCLIGSICSELFANSYYWKHESQAWKTERKKTRSIQQLHTLIQGSIKISWNS